MAERTDLEYSDIGKMVKALGPRSGRVHLPAAQYNLDRTIQIDQPCVCLEGDVWAYNSDPNGVFESRFGTQLRLRGTTFPALSVGISRTAEGCLIRDLGIQGGYCRDGHAAPPEYAQSACLLRPHAVPHAGGPGGVQQAQLLRTAVRGVRLR